MDVYTARGVTRFKQRILTNPNQDKAWTENGDQYWMGFSKPDSPVINDKVDGYRKPSPYHCRFISSVRDRLPLVLTVDVDAPEGYMDWRRQASGTMLSTWNRQSPNLNVNELRMRILNNIKDEVFDAAMVLGELTSTVNTISGNLNRIGRSMASLKKGKPRHFYYLLSGKTRDGRRPTQRFLKESSGLFLEWKYGITPSVLDLQGAMRSLEMNLFDYPPLLVARANMKETRTYTHKVLGLEIPIVATRELKARCDYRITADGIRGLNRYGIGLSSIPTLLWDKTPFTFVLDMVIPIADIVKAWSALGGTEVVGYTETDYRSWSSPATLGSIEFNGSPGLGETTEVKAFEFDRITPEQPPMPMPFVRNPIKTGNIATALALFTQLRRGN